MKLRIEIVAVDCLLVRLFDSIEEANMPWMIAATRRISEGFGPGLIDLVPSYTTLMIHYDLRRVLAEKARTLIADALDGLQPDTVGKSKSHSLPTWYDPSVGPELKLLAQSSGLSISEVIDRHSNHEYQVFALGFVPGFAFMGLVKEILASPRLSTPRKRVAAGSVGIAERQTAAYPQASPGGWNLIGRTPVSLFSHSLEGYSLLQPGDRVRFEPVSHDEFIRLGGDDTPMEMQA
jgi:KipI family sensor histidine kinase inhibitor